MAYNSKQKNTSSGDDPLARLAQAEHGALSDSDHLVEQAESMRSHAVAVSRLLRKQLRQGVGDDRQAAVEANYRKACENTSLASVMLATLEQKSNRLKRGRDG